MCNMINIMNTTVCYTGKLLREEILIKSSHHKEKNCFSISLILYLYEMMDSLNSLNLSSFHDVCHIIMQYTLNLGMLYVNCISIKVEEKKKDCVQAMWPPNVNSSEVFARAILQESLDLVPGCIVSSLNAALLEFQWVLINLFSA